VTEILVTTEVDALTRVMITSANVMKDIKGAIVKKVNIIRERETSGMKNTVLCSFLTHDDVLVFTVPSVPRGSKTF